MRYREHKAQWRTRLRHGGRLRVGYGEASRVTHEEVPPGVAADRESSGSARAGRPSARAGLLAFVAAAVAAGVWIHSALLLYLLYVSISLVLGAIGSTTLVWMMHAWRTPDSLAKGRLTGGKLGPAHSFSLIVPARHEEAVLKATLSRLVMSDHPAFEVLVVVGDDDPATRVVAEDVADRHPGLVRVVVDSSRPKNKPKALNAALPFCTGEITGVFDAEDDVHPALLGRVDQCFQRTDADVVQAGVQLMNFRSSWLTVRNVLEYYFWFRSRLHLHAGQRFIPLGGNTVFIRTNVLRAVSGWDPDCLAEDCELGVRLSAFGAHTVVFYEPELVTREECPPTLGAFARQRTRWNQGYLQTLSRGYWRRLPLRQRALGVYILAMPYLLALAWLMIPVAIATAVAVKAPVLLTLVSFLPALPMLSILAVEIAGLGDFCRAYGERASARDYARLVLGLPLYQAVLAFAAARAVVREARGHRGWEKTAHLGLHLARRPDEAQARSDGRLRVEPRRTRKRCGGQMRSPSQFLALPSGAASLLELPRPLPERSPPRSLLRATDLYAQAPSLGQIVDRAENGRFHGHAESLLIDRAGRSGNGGDRSHRSGDATFRAHDGEPLWMRLRSPLATGSTSTSLLRPGLVSLARAAGSGLGGLRGLLRKAVMSPAHVALLLVLISGIGMLLATNALHWPPALFDEGTYVGNAWAVQHGRLAPYTYSYGHPPLGWLLIFFWTWASGAFGHGRFSIDGGRELMLVVSLVSCWLLYILGRRLDFGRAASAGAVILFALSPVALFFHRAVLLDNPAIAWALAAFVLAVTPRRRLWAFAASGACFAASVLSKETTFVLLPALLVAAGQNTDQRTRRYCATLFVSSLGVLVLTYPLYAALKGELLPGAGHVSLVGYTIVQLFTRQATGSVLDPHSITHATVAVWLRLDPWLLGAALALSPLALARRTTRAVALAYLIQVAMILRPGYLPSMYVIGLLPFAALTVAGSGEALWRTWRLIRPRTSAWFVALVIGALAFAVVIGVALRWTHSAQVATTAKPDEPARVAERWLVDNVDHQQRLIVDDEFWIYLIEHGFDAQPVHGGFYSRTVVSYWPLDYDPAVRRYFPHGWRDFDYIVATEPIRVTRERTPEAGRALDHSRVLVVFGRGAQRIEIRAITASRPPG